MELFKDVRAKYEDVALLLFRVVVGFLFLAHGAQKFGLLDGTFKMPGSTLMLVAGALELVGGLLVMLGVFTVIVSFVLSGQMAVAFFMAHFPKAYLPIANGGEPAVLFCFAFLYLVFRGGGRYAIDALWCKK